MRWLVSLLFVLLLAACGSGSSTGPAKGPVPTVGSDAPSFSLLRLDGRPLSFPGDFAGKPVIIRFWAETCHFCEAEMKAIEQAYPGLKARGVEVLAVNVGQAKATVDGFFGRLGLTYPALIDESSETARLYGVTGLPTSFFIDASGKVRAKLVGEADEARFASLVKEIAP